MPVRVGLKVIEQWKSSMEAQVLAYEKEPVVTGQIVFYGPSDFTRWREQSGNPNLRDSLLGASGKPCCINRGFGSSCSEHHLYYYSRMVRPLQPKVLVYRGFGNSENFGYTPEETWELAQRVIAYAQTDFPGIHIYLHGPAWRATWRWNDPLWHSFCEKEEAFQREFAKNTPGCTYVDIRASTELKDDSLFVEDGVHYNAKGYALYGEFFKEVLKDELAKF